MATVSSATGTGHSPRQERKVAGILTFILSVAIVAAVVFFFIISKHSSMNPYQSDRPAATAPDVPTDKATDRSGAVAVPQNPPPTGNPETPNNR